MNCFLIFVRHRSGADNCVSGREMKKRVKKKLERSKKAEESAESSLNSKKVTSQSNQAKSRPLSSAVLSTENLEFSSENAQTASSSSKASAVIYNGV